MRSIPKKKPPRAKFRPSPAKPGEYEIKLRARVKTYYGETKEIDSAWCLTIKDAEESLRQRSLKHITPPADMPTEILRPVPLMKCLQRFIAYEEKVLANMIGKKTSTQSDKVKNAKSLSKNYTPKWIATKNIYDVNSNDIVKWIVFINSSPDHKDLSGSTVKRYKGIIKLFCQFLFTESYIGKSKRDEFEMEIEHTKTKRKEYGQRTDRNFPKEEDFRKIVRYYTMNKNGTLGTFENFYWYSLFFVLYFTGMREGELVALRWKNIHFDVLDKKTGKLSSYIKIDNSISEKEKEEAVMERLRLNNLSPKNENSIREIPIWDAYKELLQDYKESYHYKFKTVGSMDDMFVFPNIRTRGVRNEDIPYKYQRHKNVLRELDETTAKLGMPKYDIQMFRHGTVYFLCMNQGMAQGDCIDYIGHADEEMIRKVYLNITVSEKREMSEKRLSDVITAKFNQEYIEQHTKHKKHHYVPDEDLEDRRIWGKIYRIAGEILRTIEKGQRIYEYSAKNEDYVHDARCVCWAIDEAINEGILELRKIEDWDDKK